MSGAAESAALQPPLGQGEALQRLLRAARRRRLHHGLIVEGAVGSGRATVIRWLTAALLCGSELDADGPCGICRHCRRVAAENHPDVHVVRCARSDDEAGELRTSVNVIKVDQVRGVLGRPQRDTRVVVDGSIATHAVEGGARVLVFHDADLLNDEAQNALLKTLEEPGSDTYLLLRAARPEVLLATIRSRVERLRLVPLRSEQIREELQRRLPARSGHHERAVAHARGSLGLALELCTEQAVQLQDLVHELLTRVHRLRIATFAGRVLHDVDGRAEAVRRVRLFLRLLRSSLAEAVRSHLERGADPAYAALQTRAWTECTEHTALAERDLELQIAPDQALVGCLLQLQSVLGA